MNPPYEDIQHAIRFVRRAQIIDSGANSVRVQLKLAVAEKALQEAMMECTEPIWFEEV